MSLPVLRVFFHLAGFSSLFATRYSIFFYRSQRIPTCLKCRCYMHDSSPLAFSFVTIRNTCPVMFWLHWVCVVTGDVKQTGGWTVYVYLPYTNNSTAPSSFLSISLSRKVIFLSFPSIYVNLMLLKSSLWHRDHRIYIWITKLGENSFSCTPDKEILDLTLG